MTTRPMKLIITERRFAAMRCSELNCKKPRVIFVRVAAGKAGLCTKHWNEWTAQRQSADRHRHPNVGPPYPETS